MAEKKQQRIQVDVAEMIDKIDRYPEAAGVDSEMWAEMTYPQKLRYLLKQQLKVVDEALEEMDE